VTVRCRRQPHSPASIDIADLECVHRLQLLDMQTDELMKLLPARAGRKLKRGLSQKHTRLIKKLRKAKTSVSGGEPLLRCIGVLSC